MRRLSSIFSFSTPRLPRTAPKAALLAVVLLVGLEGAARVALRSGQVKPDPSLHSLIAEHRVDVQENDYDVWMFGNSMLEWGVDAEDFRRLTGQRAAVLAHGNATPRASVALLKYYLENTKHRPRSVLIFLAEDDTNRNGVRAQESQRYLDYVSNDERPSVYERLALYSARDNLRAAAARPVGGIPQLPVWRKRSRSGDEEFAPGDAEEPTASAYSVKLLKKFKYDDGVLHEFRRTLDAFGVRGGAVVVVPQTDVNARIHDRLAPKFTSRQIRSYIAKTCASDKVKLPLMDPGDPSKVYPNFRDAYHLNNAGRKRYTAVVAAWYLAQANDPAQTERAEQIRSQAVQAMAELGLASPLP